MAVNLGGVNSMVSRTFLPRMLAHGEGGHIVNTSSIGAVSPGPGLLRLPQRQGRRHGALWKHCASTFWTTTLA